MIGFVNPFARKNRGAGESAARIKDWVRKDLNLQDDIVVSVNQISCRDAGCAEVETVIGVLRPDAPVQMLRVLRPIAEVTEHDVRAANRQARQPLPSGASAESTPIPRTER